MCPDDCEGRPSVLESLDQQCILQAVVLKSHRVSIEAGRLELPFLRMLQRMLQRIPYTAFFVGQITSVFYQLVHDQVGVYDVRLFLLEKIDTRLDCRRSSQWHLLRFLLAY